MVAYYIPFANEISIKESVHYTVPFSQTDANMDLVRKTLYRVLPLLWILAFFYSNQTGFSISESWDENNGPKIGSLVKHVVKQD